MRPLSDGDDSVLYVESWHRQRDGEKRLLAWWCKVLKDYGGNVTGVLSTARDITEVRRLQELELRVQRLETAGRVADQVAHDFNNLLGPLMAYPDLIRDELGGNHPALPYLSDIEKTAEQIAEINQQLLTLGRRGHYNQEALNLNEVVIQAVNEMKPLPDTLKCNLTLSPDLMDIIAGRAQIHRLLTNLIHNARDAMQEIGVISFRTENYYVDEVSVAFGRVPKGEYVKLTISDTGQGISDEIMQRIFDPFFTTKTSDKKRGSGLGLSVVDAVVKDHHGYIDIRSQVGAGTDLFLYFPITRESAKDRGSPRIFGGNETVLVVDDDRMQREVSLRLLHSLGYRADAVANGEEAIKFLCQGPPDLMILDMIMPGGMDGTETYMRALEINPAQKVIIVSGYAESEQVRKAIEMGARAFIKKPLTRRVLAEAVRKELDSRVRKTVH